jgi:hypothetical protein
MLKFIAISIFSITAFANFASADDSAGSCDVTSSVKEMGKGAQFTQIETCPDATATTQLICTQGSKTIAAILPVGFESAAGSNTEIAFEIGTEKFRETLRASGEGGAKIDLKSSDPLWVALAKPGTVITASTDVSATNISTSELATGSMAKFKQVCGL